MRRGAIALLALAALLLASRARASEQSEALSARGLIALNAGRTQEAIQLFDQAVGADPTDPYARYYRGNARAKLKDYPAAIDDLRAALAIKPDFAQAALELGVALTESGQYAEAIPWLEQARARPELDAQASFFLGLAQLRLNRPNEAQQSFERARTLDASLTVPARYYEGVLAYRARDFESATDHFNAVVQGSPDSAMGSEAQDYLELIEVGRPANYYLFGTLAFEYDTNVTLGPDIPGAVVTTGEADGRAVLNGGAGYRLGSVGPFNLSASYEFFQSLQFELDQFNLQDNRPALQLAADFGRIYLGVIGRYDYYLLSDDSFLSETTAFPWVGLQEEGLGRTEVYYRMQRRDYKQLSFEVLSGYFQTGGIRQIVEVDGRYWKQFWIGYEFELTDPFGFVNVSNGTNSEQFQYASNALEIAGRWQLPYTIAAQAGYRYEGLNYNPASSVFPPFTGTADGVEVGPSRHDNDNRIVVSFERPLSEHWFVSATWFGTFHQSNKEFFEYNRQIGSIALQARY